MALRTALPLFPHRGHRLLTAAAIQPITAAELRTQLKLDAESLSGTEAAAIIAQATSFLEEMTGLAFINQTWRLTLDAWPGYQEPWWDGVRQMAISELTAGTTQPIVFPRYPLSSVSAVTTYDDAEVATVVSISANFAVDTESRPGRMMLKAGKTWPTADRVLGAIRIDYVAGYGTTATAVPAALRGAVLALAAYYYEHRGECDMTAAAEKSGALQTVRAYALRGL